MQCTVANELNPEPYLKHLLTVLPEQFAYDLNANVDDLLPWTVGMRAAFGRNSPCSEIVFSWKTIDGRSKVV